MTDFHVSYGCGDYPTNDLSSEAPRIIKEDKAWAEKMRKRGYYQDSTGCWFHPNEPSVFGEDV